MKKYLVNKKIEFYENYDYRNFLWLDLIGSSRYFIVPSSINELIGVLRKLKGRKYYVIGSGSKSVFIKKRVRYVICIKKLDKVLIKDDMVILECGVSINKLILNLKKMNKSLLEDLYLIPGLVGPSLVLNSGAFESEISENLISVKVFDKNKIREIPKSDLKFKYRYSSLKAMNVIILELTMRLKEKSEKEIELTLDKIRNYRNLYQLMGRNNIGSIFKNINELKISRIIEFLKLDNFKYKNISLAKINHNFLNVEGSLKGRDLLVFTKKLKRRIYKELGIKIETEIVFLK